MDSENMRRRVERLLADISNGEMQEIRWIIFATQIQENMVQQRRSLGLDRKIVAERMGISEDSLTELETMRFPDYRASTLARWARALNGQLSIGVKELLIDEEEKA